MEYLESITNPKEREENLEDSEKNHLNNNSNLNLNEEDDESSS